MQGVAAAFGLANLAGTGIAWYVLSRRMRGLDGPVIVRSLVRMHVATVPAAVFGLATMFAVGVVLPPGPAYGIVTVLFGGSGALLLYLLFAKALGVTDVTALAAGLRTRLGR